MKRLALMLALAGCGHSDYRSGAGVSYNFDGATWDPVQIEAQEQGFIAALPSGYDASPLAEVEVTVHPGPFPCWASSRGCVGLQDFQRLDIADPGCPGQSALTHEMAHWLQQAIRGVDDYGHRERLLFLVADARYPGSCLQVLVPKEEE